MPKVSVILPAYNAEKFIAAALDSMLAQTFRDFELIVINDCSADRTEEIIWSYDDPRIFSLKNEKNLGVAGTLNRGLSLAKGTYIARMDADDISLPNRLEKQVQYLDSHPEVAVLGTNVALFNENGIISTGWSATTPEQMKIDMFFSCGLAHPSVMARTAVLRELGGYDATFEGLEDYELWCRAAERGGVTTLPDVLLHYRLHGDQVTKNPSDKYLDRLRRLKQRQLERLGIPFEGDAAQCYWQLCTGWRPAAADEVMAVTTLFERVLEANAPLRYYDPLLLEQSFRGLLLRAAAGLEKAERRQVCDRSRFVGTGDLALFRFKQAVKELIGRK